MATPKSLFVFCMGDFATKLRIRAEFVEVNGLHHRPQISLRLKTQSAPRSWAVKIKKINGDFYITDGWSKFVEDNDILERKLLIFYIVGDSTLHVSIFGHDSCLELPSSSSEAAARKWRMVKELKDSHFKDQRMKLPKEFAEAIQVGKKGEIDLEDWKGRKWPITITGRNARKYSFSGGWKTFLRGHKLRVGAILLFEFASDSDDVVKVVLLENELGEQMLAQAKYGGIIST